MGNESGPLCFYFSSSSQICAHSLKKAARNVLLEDTLKLVEAASVFLNPCSGFKCSKLNCGLRTTGKFTVLLTCTAALHALDTDGNPKQCVIVLTDQHVSDATDIIPKSKIFERLDL